MDECGRPAGPFLPAGKAAARRSVRSHCVPAVRAEKGNPQREPALLELRPGGAAREGAARRALSGRAPVLVVLQRTGEALDVHLVSTGEERAQGAMLFLGEQVAGGVRRGRFVSADAPTCGSR